MSLSRIAVAIVTSASLAVSACTAPAEAPGTTPAANTPAAESEVPSEPGRQLSALAPENITKARPAAPFDLTGNWFISGSVPGGGWLFGRTPAVLPKLTPPRPDEAELPAVTLTPQPERRDRPRPTPRRAGAVPAAQEETAVLDLDRTEVMRIPTSTVSKQPARPRKSPAEEVTATIDLTSAPPAGEDDSKSDDR